jgi:hypothetical protein
MPRVAQKYLTNHRPKVDLRDLKNSGWWMRIPRGVAIADENSVVIDWCGACDPIGTNIPHLGGFRLWFECPQCGMRARIVYAPRFACRTCLGLIHPSTRKSRLDRSLARATQVRRSLGGTGALLDPFPMRPLGMKRKTWLRLFERAHRAEGDALAFVEKFLGRSPR